MQFVVYGLIIIFSFLFWKVRYIDAVGALSSSLLMIVCATWGGDRIGDPLILLIVYCSIVLMTIFKKTRKKELYMRVMSYEKKHSIKNVLGKLVIPTLMSVLNYREAFIAVVAYGIADSAGSQLGILSKEKPRLITTFKPVLPGTNGAISALGTSLGILFSLGVGVTYSFISEVSIKASISGALIGGLMGNIADSFLGATLENKLYADDWITNLLAGSITILLCYFFWGFLYVRI